MNLKILLRSILLLGFLAIYLSGFADEDNQPLPRHRMILKSDQLVDVYLQKSLHYLKENFDSSYFYAQQAETLAIGLNDSVGEGLALFLKGELKIRRNLLSDASEDFLKSLDLLIDFPADSLKAIIFTNLGAIRLYQDNYHNAAEYLFQGLHISEDIENKSLLFNCNLWIARLFEVIKYQEGATKYYEKALEISKSFDTDEGFTQRRLMSVGDLYSIMKEYEMAKEYYLMALDTTVVGFNQAWAVNIYIELGKIYFEEGNYDIALDYFKKTLESVDQMEKTDMVLADFFTSSALIQIGKDYQRTGDYEKAIDIFSEAIQFGKMNNHNRLVIESLKYIGSTYERKGNIDSAFRYNKIYYHLKDSIFNAATISEISRIEMGHVHYREINEKRLNQLKAELKYRKAVQTFRLLLITGILLFIIIILAFIIFRNKHKVKIKEQQLQQEKLEFEKLNLQNELDVKNRELTTSVIYLLKKNNFLHNISDDFKAAINANKHNNVKAYSEIIKSLNSSMSKDAWEEFETRFHSVHQSFNENLLKDFPDLTPNDLKICAFLKLNMSTKEIETITFQSNNSITVARHRLRTKLKLERNENLVTFLSKY